MKNLIHVFSIILLVVGFTQCKCQPNVDAYFIQNSLLKYNLKGSVKSLSTNFDRFYPVNTPREKLLEYEIKNYWGINQFPMGKVSFDIFGFLEESYYRYADDVPGLSLYDSYKKRWVFIYDIEDFKKKMIQFDNSSESYLHPILNPYKVKVNNSFYDENSKGERSDTEVQRFYHYEVDQKGLIRYELEKNEKYIEIRKVYIYDENNRIIRQEMIFMEELPANRRLFMDVKLEPWYFLFSIDQVGYYEYAYSDDDKLSMYRLVMDEQIIFQEDYFYEEDSWRPIRLERYVESKITSGYQYSDYSTEWYNEFGDITKAENYDNDKNLIRTQYYDYEYDEHNNWVECRMYLEGQPERTEKPTIVAHRSIEYYEE